VKIGIETSLLQHPAGMGKYLSGLLQALPQVDSKNSYVLLKNPLWSPDQFGQTKSIPMRLCSGLKRLWGEQVILPWIALRQEVNVLFVPDYIGPIFSRLFGFKLVVVFYDMAFVLRPQEQHPWYLAYFRLLAPLTAKIAHHVITISHTSKNDVMHLFRVPADKIAVTHLASMPIYRCIENRYEVRQAILKYGLDMEQYILHVGTADVRKNIPCLIEAFSILATDFPYLKLVLVGSQGWKNKEEIRIQQAIQTYNLTDRVLRLGYVFDKELVYLYNGAALFAFPSLYEGFGIPVLEAMSCGTPVVTSNVSSLPEVSGDAAVLINPESADDLASAMRTILNQPTYRQTLIERGIERARQFSWERTARETVHVFESVYLEHLDRKH